MSRRLLRVDPNIWLLLALSGFAWLPLLTPAYFLEAHDARHSLFFLVEFDQTWRDGYFWPRWSPDFAFGYGYPLFNLYAPLAFFAAEALHLMGLGFLPAIKTMLILATVGAGIGMYLFARDLFGRAGGLLAAVVYMYVPFHLAEIYVRTAYAEFVALALLPLILWAFTGLVAAPSFRRLALAALAYGSLALTHHTSFFTFTPFLAVYILFLLLKSSRGEPAPRRLKAAGGRLLYAAGAGLLGLGLAAIYLLPLLVELPFIRLEQWQAGSYNYLQHFVYFSQLVSPYWGYGYSGEGLRDGMSFQLGIAALAVMAFAGVRAASRPVAGRGVALFFIAATVVIVWLMSPAAVSAWNTIPLASLVQFPWRLLTLTMLTMAVGAGALLARVAAGDQPAQSGAVENRAPLPTPTLVLALVVILASFPYTLPQYTAVPDWAETPLAVVNWDRASISDRVAMVAYTQEQPQTSPMEAQYLNGEALTVAGIVAGEGQVETIRHGGASDEVLVRAGTPVTLQFYTYEYPGWRVTDGGQVLDHRPEPPYGLITVDLPAGEHRLELRMGSTPSRLLGGVISGLALAVIGLGPALARRRAHQEADRA